MLITRYFCSMEFVDENLEAAEQQTSTLPVTTQPTSLYSATDICKLLHVQGISVYTDVWTTTERTVRRIVNQQLQRA